MQALTTHRVKHHPLGRRTLALAAFVVAAAVSPAVAQALPNEADRVAIGSFRGPQASKIQDAVENALLRRYYLVPGSLVNDAARKSGVALQSAADFTAVAKRLNVQAFVTGTVIKSKTWRVQMVVRRGDTGQPVGMFDFADRRLDALASAIAKTAPRRVQAVLAVTASPPRAIAVPASAPPVAVPTAIVAPPVAVAPAPVAPAPVMVAMAPVAAPVAVAAPSLPALDAPATANAVAAAAEEEPEETVADEAPAPEKPGVASAPFVEIALGGKIFNRTMSYTDNVSNLPGYRLGRATAIAMDIAFHPFALGGPSVLSELGLIGGVTYGIGVGTALEGVAGRARTDVHGYEAGVRYRLRVGPIELLPRAAYSVDAFVARIGELSPDVRYQNLRLGSAARLPVSSKIGVRASVDYLSVMSAGPLSSATRFPRASAHGVDLGVGAGYALSPTIEAQVTLGMRRYGFNMRAVPGDAPLAGGAVDEYMSMVVGLAYRPSLSTPTVRR